jgi:hypothetical protein
MKNLALLFITLAIAGVVPAAAPQIFTIPFELGLQKFIEGDSIVIRDVQATSPKMDVGDTVVVRGRYTFTSGGSANLGLSLTQTGPAEPTRISPAANQTVQNGTGDFELTFEVRKVGCLHLTFSSLPERKSVGTVYFGTPAQLARVRNMRW